MNNKLTFAGGEPNMNENDFLRIQAANRLALHGLTKGLSSENFIVSGCVTTPNGSNIDITEGYIFLDGELIKVDAQINVPDTEGNGFYKYEKQTAFEAGGDKTYLDSTPRQTWEKNRGVAVSVAAIGADLSVKNGKRFTDIVNGDDWTPVTIAGTDWTLIDVYVRMVDKYTMVIIGRCSANDATPSSTILTLPTGFWPANLNRLSIPQKGYGTSTVFDFLVNVATNGTITWATATAATPDEIYLNHTIKFN